MKTNSANNDVISVKEVMRRLDCGRSTVYRLMKDGTLDSISIRGSRRIRVESVDKIALEGAA